LDGPNQRQLAVRDTWYNDSLLIPTFVEFFDGERCNCPDDHMHVVHKGMFAYKWAYENKALIGSSSATTTPMSASTDLFAKSWSYPRESIMPALGSVISGGAGSDT
jgi:hypothetical protein